MEIKIVENGETVYKQPLNFNKIEHSLYSASNETVVVLRREKDMIIIERTKLEKENPVEPEK